MTAGTVERCTFGPRCNYQRAITCGPKTGCRCEEETNDPAYQIRMLRQELAEYRAETNTPGAP